MFFDPHHPDALDEVLAVTEEIDAIMAARYLAIERMQRAAFHGEEHANGTRREVILRSVRLELAAALRVTEHAAGALLATADYLVNTHPDALQALGEGRITEQHARALVTHMTEVPTEIHECVSAAALALAERLSVGPFRRALQKLLEQTRYETLEERHNQALTRRRIELIPERDGMASLSVYAPAVELRAIFERATAIAKHLGDRDGEERTRDQLRTDVVCDLLLTGSAAGHPAAAREIRASVVVTVPALSLIDGTAGEGDAPVVEGVGPIPLRRARELCGNAEGWMRVLTHPETGMVLSVGRTQYRPPAALRRLVRWRSDRCMAPGCSVPASRCEIDHTIAWQDGGHTSLDNHAPLCKGHHTIKHHGNWSVRQIPGSGGALQWTSPTGRVYRVEPERRVPVFTPDAPPPDDDAVPPWEIEPPEPPS